MADNCDNKVCITNVTNNNIKVSVNKVSVTVLL